MTNEEIATALIRSYDKGQVDLIEGLRETMIEHPDMTIEDLFGGLDLVYDNIDDDIKEKVTD